MAVQDLMQLPLVVNQSIDEHQRVMEDAVEAGLEEEPTLLGKLISTNHSREKGMAHASLSAEAVDVSVPGY